MPHITSPTSALMMRCARCVFSHGASQEASSARLYQRRMLYWHRFAPESRMMRKVTDALLEHGHLVLRQD